MVNTFRKIAFGYSTQCNIKCGHCVAADDDQKKAKMDLARAKAIVSEMALAHVKGISFTAGEPLLFLNDIVELLGVCKKNGIYSRVVTNGFWAKTPRCADDIVSELKTAGLAELRISYSRWHQKHVDRENIVSAAQSSKKLGLDYFISFVTDFSKQDEPYEQYLRDNRLRFFPEPVIYFGRARNFNRPKVFTDYNANRCDMNPYLSPQLDMFACCDAGDRFDQTGFLYLGNLNDHSVEFLFKKYERNRLYHAVKTVGLTPMAASLGIPANEIVTYRKCELCERLLNSKENLTGLQQSADSTPSPWTR